MSTLVNNMVVTDEKDYQKFVDAVLKCIETFAYRHKATKRERLQQQLAAHMKSHGVIAISFVEKEFIHDIEQQLIKANIPYTTVNNMEHETAFIVREQDREKLFDIEKAYMQQNTKYYRQSTPERMVESTELTGNKQVVELTFNDRASMLIAQQKLYQSGITCGIIDFGETEEGKLSGKIIISSNSIYNKNREDLAAFELKYAVSQVAEDNCITQYAPNLAHNRQMQAIYDDAVITKFAESIKAKEQKVLGNINDGTGIYLETDGEHTFLKHPGQNNVVLSISPDATITEIKALIINNTENIYNMTTMSKWTWDDKILGKSGDQIDSETKNSVINMQGCGKRPVVTGMEQQIKNMLNNDITNRLLKDIENYANKEVCELNYSDVDKYKRKKEIMANVLKGNTLIIDDFLNNNDLPLTYGEKKDLLIQIAEHLENTHEKTKTECTVDIQNITRELRARIQKEAKYARTSSQNKEHTKEKEDERNNNQERE